MRQTWFKVVVACFLFLTAGLAEAQVVKKFRITGNSTGVGWSHGIVKNGSLYCQGVVSSGTVQPGADCAALTSAFVNSLRLHCEQADHKYRIELGTEPCTFTITQFNNDAMQFWVGAESGNPTSGCQVTNNPAGCSFNPLIQEIIGTAFCFGDGSGFPCPCSNPGAGGEGCANSTGQGAVLSAAGSTSVAADDIVFSGDNLLPGQPALFFAGLNTVNGGAGFPFGDGLRCAGDSVVRLGVKTPNAIGDATWGPGLGTTGGWGAGDTRRFQVWYRDPADVPPCAAGFNLSNGLEISFVP